MKSYVIVLFTLVLLCQCRISTRIALHNLPSVKDYKVFPTDTLQATAQDGMSPFVNANNLVIPPLNSWVVCRKPLETKNFDEFLEASKTTAFIVVRNDSILYENYANGYTAIDKHIIFSISKVFTTSLVDIAIQEGHIESVSQKVSDFLPSFKTKERDKITINDLLNMTSGLNHDDYNKPLRSVKAYYHPNLDKLVDRTKMKYEAGSEFAYKSLETQVLGLCIEKATGVGMTDYLRTRLWNKLDMSNDALMTLDKKNGNERMFGGMAVTPRDLLKLGRLFLNKGRYKGEQIISKQWINDIENRKKYSKWWGYKSGWWRDVFNGKEVLDGTDYFAGGYGGQCLYIDPKTNTIIIRLGKNYGKGIWHASLSQLSKIINHIPLNNVVKTQNLGGIYQSSDGKQLILNHRKDKTWMIKYQGKKLVLQPYCANAIFHHRKFFSRQFFRVIFKTNNQKEVKGFYFDDGKDKIIFFEKLS